MLENSRAKVPLIFKENLPLYIYMKIVHFYYDPNINFHVFGSQLRVVIIPLNGARLKINSGRENLCFCIVTVIFFLIIR